MHQSVLQVGRVLKRLASKDEEHENQKVYRSISPLSHILLYDLVFKDGKTLKIRCVANEEGERRHAAKILKLLWENGFNKGRFTVARPFGYYPKYNAMFYGNLPGENLTHILKEKNFQRILASIELSARWLAKLHNLNLKTAKKLNRQNDREQITELAKIFSRLKKYYPDLAKKESLLIKEYFNLQDKIDWKNTVLIHNDFFPGNIISHQNKISAIDFVESRMANPLIDVASLAAYMQSILNPISSLSSEQLEQIESKFVLAYFKARGLAIFSFSEELIVLKFRAFLYMLLQFSKIGIARLNYAKQLKDKKLEDEYYRFWRGRITDLIKDADFEKSKLSKKIDLHSHTFLSDGFFSPKKLVSQMKRRKISVAALTDHNGISGSKEFNKEANINKIETINGVEIYAKFKHLVVHILLYNFDLNNKKIIKMLENSQKNEDLRIKKMIKKLQKAGFEITWKQLKEQIGSVFIDIGHLTSVVLKNEKNLRKIKTEVLSVIKSRNDFWHHFENQHYHERDSVFEPLSTIPIKKVFKTAKQIGAISVLAHPGETFGFLKKKKLLEFKKMGLDGIEAFTRKNSLEQEKYYLRLAKELNLIVTGGTDWHRMKDDFQGGEKYTIPYYVYQQLKYYLNRI